jgi:hypothetical protein
MAYARFRIEDIIANIIYVNQVKNTILFMSFYKHLNMLFDDLNHVIILIRMIPVIAPCLIGFSYSIKKYSVTSPRTISEFLDQLQVR